MLSNKLHCLPAVASGDMCAFNILVLHVSSMELLVGNSQTLAVSWCVCKTSENMSMQETSQTSRQGGNLLNLDLMPAAEYKASQGHEPDVAGRQPESPLYRSGIDVNFLREHDI